MQPDKTAIQNLRSAKGDLDKKKKSKENEVKDIEKEEKQLKGELKDIEKHRSDLEGVVSKASTIPIILIAIYSFIASVYFSCYSCYVFTYSGIPGHWATREMSICWIYGRLPCHSRFHSSPQDQPVWLICDNAKVVSIIKNMEALDWWSTSSDRRDAKGIRTLYVHLSGRHNIRADAQSLLDRPCRWSGPWTGSFF